ncbi:MAG: LysM peptidoglycan-binding domain-containing protein [bacterium]|nr:LysM peptidoglycan-binding domain-containing protein [bacterium]
MTLRLGIFCGMVLSGLVVLGGCSSKSSTNAKMATDESVAMDATMPPAENLDMDTTGTGSGGDTFAAGDGDIPAAPATDLMPGSTAGSYSGSTPGYGAIASDNRGYPDYATPRRGGSSGSGSASGSSYTIQRGDTLWGLSRRYGVSVSALASANGISQNAILRVGHRLTIPGAGGSSSAGSSGSAVSGAGTAGGRTYRVQRGDTYSGLAHKFGVSSQRLMELNSTSSPTLREGQTLRIP